MKGWKRAEKMTEEKLNDLRNGFETAYIDRTYASNLAFKPQFISNNHRVGRKVITFKLVWLLLRKAVLLHFCRH